MGLQKREAANRSEDSRTQEEEDNQEGPSGNEDRQYSLHKGHVLGVELYVEVEDLGECT